MRPGQKIFSWHRRAQEILTYLFLGGPLVDMSCSQAALIRMMTLVTIDTEGAASDPDSIKHISMPYVDNATLERLRRSTAVTEDVWFLSGPTTAWRSSLACAGRRKPLHRRSQNRRFPEAAVSHRQRKPRLDVESKTEAFVTERPGQHQRHLCQRNTSRTRTKRFRSPKRT